MESNSTNVMLIEDNPGDARLIRQMLQDCSDSNSFQLEWFDRLNNGINSLESFAADIILLDLELPDSQGKETFEKLYKNAPDTPIVIMSGLDDEFGTIKQVLQEGAQDYLIKGQVDSELLVRAMNYAIDRKKSELKLKKALEVKSEFMSTVSHELRTPLTAIKEGIGIVLDGSAGEIGEEQKQYLEIAKRNVDRLARLINDVLDFQKLESGKVKPVLRKGNVNEVIIQVKETMEPLAKEKDLHIEIDSREDLSELNFDHDGITQVLTNLISNAIKFTESGSITIKAEESGNCVRVSVHDTGPGIAEHDIPRLFNEFEQLSKGNNRKTGGTGLGLVISQKIIENHNGKIWVESEFGQWSRFSFVLPIFERRNQPSRCGGDERVIGSEG